MLSSGGVTERLDRLEAAHLIERHPDPSDRRGVLIKLSHAGLDLIDRAVVAVTDLEERRRQRTIGSEIRAGSTREQPATHAHHKRTRLSAPGHLAGKSTSP